MKLRSLTLPARLHETPVAYAPGSPFGRLRATRRASTRSLTFPVHSDPSHTAPTMTPDPELLDCFRDEVGGYLPAIAEALARSEATVTPDDLERLHRHAHSVKGSAALLGFTELATVAGDLEALFERVTGGGPWTPATHAAAAGLVDAIVIHLEALDTPPETPTGSDNAVPAELLEVFALEAAEHLATIRTVLPELRDRPRDKERLQEVRRAAHTLKGAAAMVGFKAVTRLAHTMEDALDAYYESADGVPAAMLPTLMRSADYLADLADGTPAEESRLAALLTEYDGVQVAQCVTLDAESPRTEPVSRGELSLRVPVARLDGVARLVGDLVQERAAFAQRTAEYGAMLEELRLAAARMRRAARQLERESELRVAPVRGTAHGFDDLEFDRYTDLNLLSRELAETTSDIAAIGGELAHLFGDIDGYLARETTLTRDIQETLTRARLVPLSTLGVSLERTVRTVAESRGKAARFVLDGGSTELDKTVLDELAEPLLHLLRNAVDHGLEPPDVRLAAGKPAAGTVTVRATQVGTQVVVTVADDGGGVDLARVRAKAVANGLIDADAGLSEAEALELLFRAGFSTAAELSEVSGRGVGLDIVRAKVEKLKGTLALASVPGVGATFTVRLPLTLAVTRALLVRAAGQTFALPLAAVERVVHLDEAGEWIAERGLGNGHARRRARAAGAGGRGGWAAGGRGRRHRRRGRRAGGGPGAGRPRGRGQGTRVARQAAAGV